MGNPLALGLAAAVTALAISRGALDPPSRSRCLPAPNDARGGQEKPVPGAAGERPSAETKTIAGLVGFESVSALTYDEAPEAVHRLIATYIFPDRARWFLGVKEGDAMQRQMRYRSHDRFFSIDGRSASSRELEGPERVLTEQQMELRRATMLWPDGFDWKIEGREARVELGALGTLRAQFDTAPGPLPEPGRSPTVRPSRVGLFSAGGQEQESFRALTWHVIRERTWPATAELWHDGKRIWREHFDSVETAIRFVDSYFLPGDRRETALSTAPPAGQVQRMELPATVACRLELKAGDSWEDALAEVLRWQESWTLKLKPDGLELDPKVTIEISAQARPIACILRLATAPIQPPKEFGTVSARPGFGVLVSGVGEVTPAKLSLLERALPKGSKVLPAYVRFDREQARGGPVLIVLPTAGER